MNHNRYLVIGIATTIFIIALFTRLYKITVIPPGLYPDEAMNGVNALEAAQNSEYKIFYPENNGREGMFINIQSVFVKTLGNKSWALRIPSAIFGALTAMGLFLLAFFLFGKNRRAFLIAVFSALFITFGFWHLNFSRIGFRAITMPFFMVWSLLFFTISIQNWQKKWRSLGSIVSAGILLGLGLHGYTPFRLVPFLFAALIIALLIQKRIALKNAASRIGIFILITFLVFLPLALNFLNNSGYFVNRANPIYFFQQEAPLTTIGFTLIKYFGMLNFVGDCNSRHNLSCWPELNPFVSAFFLIGVAGLIRKRTRYANVALSPSLVIFMGLGIGMLPGILASEGAPHALRTIGAAPFAYIIAGFGAMLLYEKIAKFTPSKYGISFAIFLITLISAIGFDLYRYFYLWPRTNPDFSQKYLEEANYLKKLPGLHKYIIVNASTGVTVNNIPITIMPSKYILWDDFKSGKLNYVLPEQLETFQTAPSFLAIPLEWDEKIMEQLKSRFPAGKISEENMADGKFEIFTVSPR